MSIPSEDSREELRRLRVAGLSKVIFAAMEELDGDDVRVSSRGRYAERDIVQVDLAWGRAQEMPGWVGAAVPPAQHSCAVWRTQGPPSGGSSSRRSLILHRGQGKPVGSGVTRRAPWACWL